MHCHWVGLGGHTNASDLLQPPRPPDTHRGMEVLSVSPLFVVSGLAHVSGAPMSLPEVVLVVASDVVVPSGGKSACLAELRAGPPPSRIGPSRPTMTLGSAVVNWRVCACACFALRRLHRQVSTGEPKIARQRSAISRG